MEKDPLTQAVTQMSQLEIELFVLYRDQLVAPSGRNRDDLPYTAEFDNLRSQYNQQTLQALSPYDFWGLLKYVLKYGEDHIEAYLRPLGITVPPKP